MPAAEDDIKVVLDARSARWSGIVMCGAQTLHLEVGFPLSDPDAVEKTRAEARRVLGLAADPENLSQLGFARKDRHRQR